MTYNEILSALMTLGAIPLNSEDSNFQRLVPACFAHAEGRIYRELSFLQTDTVELMVIPSLKSEIELPDNVLSVRSISLCVSSPSDPPGPPGGNKRRIYPQRVSPEALDMFWPQPNFKPGPPRYYTLRGFRYPPDVSSNPLPPSTQPLPPLRIPERFILIARFAPATDRIYIVEIYGGIQPVPLSEANFETFVSRTYPELLIAACMVFITGYQRDYGAASDDPQRAMSWEQQYQALKNGIAQETGRLRGEGPSFTALPPAGVAQQPRSP